MRKTERRQAVSNWLLSGITHALWISLCLFSAALLVPAPRAHADDAATRRAEAKAQFERAEKMRTALDAKPERQRSIEEYAHLVSTYRRVYLITPHAVQVPIALYQVAQIYREMGRQFGKKYYRLAVVAYQFLLTQYPTNRYRREATLAIAAIQQNDLSDPDAAEKVYRDFLKRYPRSELAAEARQALEEIEATATSEANGSTAEPPASVSSAQANIHLSGQPAEVKRIRVWNADTYTRIIIDLGDRATYQAARIPNPDRIYFDIDDARLNPTLRHQNIDVPDGGYLKSVRVAQNRPGVVRVVLNVAKVKDYSAFELTDPERLVVDVYGPNSKAAAGKRATKERETAAKETARGKVSGSTMLEKSKKAAEVTTPPPIPQPMHDGEQSLTRALGLKVSRIVIDPGHGGRDTGTIGPDGMMEKNLCLDLALRLGKLIHKHLPGAEVFYTRKTDKFVPLEQRTAIANRDKADLFISIHANSSSDPNVSGIETYYLNFNSSPEAMEVAARENAVSRNSVYQLQDLIRKIARNDKIEESRDLATDIQDSLTQEMASTRFGRNRGVRTAPFVVLIGAHMPSILAEVSFLSNPKDDRWLKVSRNREKIAEGLFHGIEGYLQETNSLAMNLTPGTSNPGELPPVAHSSKRQ